MKRFYNQIGEAWLAATWSFHQQPCNVYVYQTDENVWCINAGTEHFGAAPTFGVACDVERKYIETNSFHDFRNDYQKIASFMQDTHRSGNVEAVMKRIWDHLASIL